MFAYDVFTEEQAMKERYQVLPDGDYPALVSASLDKQSKSGNYMLDMTIEVYSEGKKHQIREFLVFIPSMMWKVIHFSESANLMQEYMLQKLCSEVVTGRACFVTIGSDGGKVIPEDKLDGKPIGSKYPPRNIIKDYVKTPAAEQQKFQDSDIPF